LVREILLHKSFTDSKCVIANPEMCKSRNLENRRSDVDALGQEMQQLVKEDPSRWSENVWEFLTLIMIESAEKLVKVCGIQMQVSMMLKCTGAIFERTVY
jgi:hypothetical protein